MFLTAAVSKTVAKNICDVGLRIWFYRFVPFKNVFCWLVENNEKMATKGIMSLNFIQCLGQKPKSKKEWSNKSISQGNDEAHE